MGRVGHPVPRGRGSRWLRDHRGEWAHQHRAFGLRRSRGGPHLLRPAGGRRNGQHQIQRHLQRRRRPHAVWRVEHRGGRSVRRTCDDDVAVGVQDVDILRSSLLHVRRRVLPALYLWWRPPLLPGAATVLLVLQLPASRRDDSRDCGRQVPGVAGRQLLQADDDQRREDGVPGGARAAGRRDGDAAGDARARERRRHHLLCQRQCVLPARDERRAGVVRGGDGTSRGRLRRGTARELRGRPAEHDVLQGWRTLLRAVPLARRRGDVRHGGHTADAVLRGGSGGSGPAPAPAAAKAPVAAPGLRPRHQRPPLSVRWWSASRPLRERSSWCGWPPT